MKSLFEETGGAYRRSGDYLIPDIALPESSIHILGKLGRMRRKYLKEHRSILFNQMVLNGTLYPHLAEIDHSCNARMEQIISAMAMTEGVNALGAADEQHPQPARGNCLTGTYLYRLIFTQHQGSVTAVGTIRLLLRIVSTALSYFLFFLSLSDFLHPGL